MRHRIEFGKKAFSTELVSEYVYFEKLASQEKNVPYYTMQAFAFEPLDALEFVTGWYNLTRKRACWGSC